MHVSYEPEDTVFWITFYKNLIAEQQQHPDQVPLQRGLGAGLPGFHGYKGYQRGAGLGNFFASLFRRALPFLKTAAKAVGKQALSTGAHIAGDMAQGRDWKEALAAHGKTGASNLFHQAGDAVADEATSAQQGKGLGTTIDHSQKVKKSRKAASTTTPVSVGGKRSRREVDSLPKVDIDKFWKAQQLK
jgi:hypothetical protein